MKLKQTLLISLLAVSAGAHAQIVAMTDSITEIEISRQTGLIVEDYDTELDFPYGDTGSGAVDGQTTANTLLFDNSRLISARVLGISKAGILSGMSWAAPFAMANATVKNVSGQPMTVQYNLRTLVDTSITNVGTVGFGSVVTNWHLKLNGAFLDSGSKSLVGSGGQLDGYIFQSANNSFILQPNQSATFEAKITTSLRTEAVPEPMTLSALGLGLAALLRKRRS
ncbi:MAG TPA: PEP-CTERM sorting domain-containing protein [Fimbriimonadaceae bacterium]|nr:PEP-CTERM sorting domain-containing protein [Fimbriimonadaceae bacterium]HRJ34295.1 PEP-CTERM sorting domain-containing protein [Fimbriimonadaceae bacterium]